MNWPSPLVHGVSTPDQTHPGYWSSVPRDQAPPGAFTGSSRDWVLDNLAREWRTRGGSNLYASAILEASSIPSAVYMRAVGGVAFHSRSMDDATVNAPDTFGFLMVDEAYGIGAAGQFAWRFDPTHTSALAWKVIGKGFDPAVDYPLTRKYWPHCGGGRLNSEADRRKQALGSRGIPVLMDGRLFFGNYQGSTLPNNWDLRDGGYAAAPGLDYNLEHLRPTGHVPPLWPPDVTVPSTVPKGSSTLTNADASGTFQAGDMFWCAVAGVDRTGAVGPMTQLRPPNQYHQAAGSGATRTVGGFGLVLLNVGSMVGAWGSSGNTRYRGVQLTVPVMDARYEKRIVYRCPKVDGSLVGAMPDISDMRPWIRIDNNTETVIYSFDGDDSKLVPNDAITRFDHVQQPNARYLCAADGRMLAVHTKRNRAMLWVAPKLTGVAAENTNGVAYCPSETLVPYKTGANEGGNLNWKFYVQVVNTGTAATSYIRFYDWDGTASVVSTATGDYTFAKFPTIQEMVDAINSQQHGGSLHVYPRAAIATGADPTAKCLDVLASTLTGSGSGTGPYGDSFTQTAVYYDLQRMYGNCLPGILMGKDAFFDLIRERKGYVFFTGAGSGHPKNAPDSWYFGNVRVFPESLGDPNGCCGLAEGALITGANGIGWFHNTKGGNTGEDEDYRIDQIPGAPGCIAPDSVRTWFGMGLYLSAMGLVAFGRGKWVVLSGAMYNPEAAVGSRGEWENEVSQCVAAQGKDDYPNQAFSVGVMGSRIRCSYRSSTGLAVTDNAAELQVEYSLGARAIDGEPASLLDPDGNPWGWSPPQSLRSTALVQVNGTAGARFFGAINTFTAAVVEGLVQELDTLGYDAGTALTLSSVTRANGTKLLYQALDYTGFRKVRIGTALSGAGMGVGSVVQSIVQERSYFALGTRTSGSAIVTADAGYSFRGFQIGAVIEMTGFAAGTTVLDVSADKRTLTLSANASASASSSACKPLPTMFGTVNSSSSGTGTVTAADTKIVPVGFSATLRPDPNPRLKNRATFFTVVHRSGGGLYVAIARHVNATRSLLDDAGWSELQVPASLTGAPFASWRHRVPMLAQAQMEAVEYRVRSTEGAPVAFRMIVTEGESIDALA